MTSASDSLTSMTTQDRELRRSVGLNQFRKSPFRLLRLPSSATAKQAVWQCDKALARARVGMTLPDPDPVPWLANGDQMELQEASQTMESPLARIVEQLLWFDFTDDPYGSQLAQALQNADGNQLRAYAAVQQPVMAHKLNQLNLRLLLGFSLLRDVGPSVVPQSAAKEAARLAWQNQAGLQTVDDPHKAIRGAGALLGGQWAALLTDAVSGWGGLLAGDELAAHIRTKIDALGDELLGHDDMETILSAIRTRIADLVVGETKLEMASGNLANVGALSSLAGKSQIDSEVWLVAFKPLRTQFQSELADLQPEAETGNGLIEDVAAYLERLGTLADRWRPLDEAQLLGLATLIDEAVGDAFGRLRGVPREKQLEPRFKEVLDRVGQIAASGSIKERVKAYKDRLADVQKAMCHFCGKRELDGTTCASLSSQREISRTRYGNTIRVQYQVGARPVGRCPTCAQRHGFVKHAGSVAFFTLSSAVLFLAAIHPSTWFQSWDFGTAAFMVAVLVAVCWGLGFVGREIAASFVTPKGERRFNNYRESNAFAGLRGDGFSSMKYDFRPDAWELVNKQGVKARHGTDSGDALKWIVQIGVVILLIALRVCLAGGGHHY